LIRQDLLMPITDTQTRPIVSRHNLITLDSGNVLGGSGGASYALEAQNKEVLHGDDPTAQRQMASSG